LVREIDAISIDAHRLGMRCCPTVRAFDSPFSGSDVSQDVLFQAAPMIAVTTPQTLC